MIAPMQRTSNTTSSGYLLIEAMVAMGVLTTSVLGIFALMSQSIKLTRLIDDRYIGTYLAAEGIETVKNMLDANIISGAAWNAARFDVDGCYELDAYTSDLSSASSVGCPDAGSTPLAFDGLSYRYGAGTSTAFMRTVHVAPIVDGGGTQEGIRVVSTVKWAGGSSSVALEDKFYAWH